MRKYFNTICLILLTLSMTGVMSGCKDDDGEFVHTDNLINQLFMMTTQEGTQYQFTIDEYDAQGNLVTEGITSESVAGGYGICHIEFDFSQRAEIDLTKVYLSADVSYDVIISPGLAGVHDISGEGIVVNVKGGNNHVRKYRIYGAFH